MNLRAPLAVCFLLAFPAYASAQTATSGVILGTVRDPQAAVVAGAEVKLESRAINVSQTQTTNTSGQYLFPNVAPGMYILTVAMQGFRTASVTDFRVEVGKSYTLDFTLELGQLTQVVQVESADVVRELQTTDSTVGNVVPGRLLPRMPALTRTANELLLHQPAAAPSGEVAGARQDQSTFALDGIDVTNQSVGGLQTFFPLPIDGVEEFRVGVANPNAQFGRGAGGQVSIISKAGSNDYHGAAFWYHQNDNLNANAWDFSRTGVKKPELKDNRFGGRFSGPYPWLRDKLFFAAHYEGRRFPQNTPLTRLVPTDSFRQGNLRFRDAAGNIVNYNLRTAAMCSATGNQPCDPRGIGLSPTIQEMWNRLPVGNDPTVAGADGLNTTGFRFGVRNPLSNDYYSFRTDWSVTKNWRVDAAFRYFRQLAVGSIPVQILDSDILSRGTVPTRQNFAAVGVRGNIASNLTGEFRFGWNRNRSATDRFRPNQTAALLALQGTDTPDGFIALDAGARGGLGADGLINEPIDVDTQVARKQANDNRNFQWNADLNWLKGSHTFQFGTHLRYLPTIHLRDDKVLGALGALVAQLDAQRGTLVLPTDVRPPLCSASLTTNCLQSADEERWFRLYASALGLIDNISVLAVRDSEFNPLPFGELLEADTKLWATEFYLQDVWRMTPSFTLTWGLNYGWQTPPKERLGRQTFQTIGATGEFVTSENYLQTRLNEMRQGRIFNPNFAFVPINDSGRSGIFEIDWNNVGPRASLAWNPSFATGWLNKLFGNRKTVIRGGYGLIYDRLNTVQTVIIPTLGVAFAQTINLTNPACNSTGAGGASCAPSSSNPALSVFRVGVDGVIPRPTVPAQSVPVSPFWGVQPGSVPGPNGLFPSSAIRLFPEILSFQVDAEAVVGKSHSIDVTWQRELPWNMLWEVGYIGRFARDLPFSTNLGQSPYLHVDPQSGQSFAQAFDALAAQVRANTANASITAQPWFENSIPAAACVVSGAPVSCTRWLAAVAGANVSFGNVSTLFTTIDTARLRAGLQPFDNYIAQIHNYRTAVLRSNYNALFTTVHKRTSHGLLFTLNYTYSRSLDNNPFGSVQNSASVLPNSFITDAEYGPSAFDFSHTWNATWLYELPFGRGRFANTSSGLLDRIIGGWFISGIFTAWSGAPLVFVQGGQVWGGSKFLGFSSGMIPTVDPGTFGNSARSGVKGSGGIGINSDPARRGSGLNLFADPAAVFNSFRHVKLSQDQRSGRSNAIRGMPRWNADATVGKRTRVNEQLQVVFTADFFNILNKVDFTDPTLNLGQRASFGVISTQFTPTNRTFGSRWIQFGLRVEF